MTVGFLKTLKFSIGAFYATLLLVSQPSLAQSSGAPDGTDCVQQILKRGKIIAAVQTQGPPISFIDKKGQRVGFAVDLVKKMAADMGVGLEMRDYDFRGLVPAAIAGQVDIVAADMAPTPQRSLQLTFSDQFFAEPVVLYAKRTKGYTDALSLNKKGITIGLAQGSANRAVLERYFPNATIAEFGGGGPALAQAAASGRVDAVINTLSNARGNALSFGDTFTVLKGELYVWPEAFAVRPQCTHLVSWVNNWLYWQKHDGYLDKEAKYWRQSDDWRADHL